ncbi:MAG: NAD(P)-dependent oxidoreductase [Pseudomonadota bacterium]
MKIGFIGLGNMGVAMALNLVRAGTELLVWNRSLHKIDALAVGKTPAVAAQSAVEVFANTRVVILMLANGAAIDEVLQRGTDAFALMVRGRTIVHMGTTSPEYSNALEADIVNAGGAYVEAPVSGSRVPAEQGKLVGMLAGEAAAVALVRPLLQPMCAQTFICGAVPQALKMKLSVNLYLIAMVGALAEATHFAKSSGVDLAVFRDILNAGPMASKVSSVKLAKLLDQDYSVQASISDVLMNARLITGAARQADIDSPLIDICRDLFARTEALGHGKEDMAAVIHAFSREQT